MQLKKISLIFISTLVLLINSFCAKADNRPGAFILTPGIGPYLFDSDRGLKNNALYNFGLGYDFNRCWGVEALAGTLHTNTKGIDNQGVTASLYTLDGVYHFNINNPFVPYLLAGAGVLNFNSNPNTNDPNAQASLNAGAGLECFLGNSLALRSDVRDVYTMTNGKSDLLVNFGVSLLLGGQTQPTASQLTSNQADQCSGAKLVIRFTNKSATLDPIYKAELQQIISCVQNDPNLRINLDGYASNGTAKNDLYLSQQRADSVKQYLVSQAGIDSSRLNAQGFGEGNSTMENNVNSQADSVVVSVFPQK